MNKITLVILLSLSVFTISSCKKSSGSAQSIAGTWKFSNIGGTSVYYTDSNNGTTTTYSYAGSAITSTAVNKSGSVTTTSTSSISVTTETWAFNGDGTYTINEVYDAGGGIPITYTSSGTWYYLSGTTPNDGFIFNGQVSEVLYNIGITTYQYHIQSVGGTLVLTIINSQTTGVGFKNTNDITITFTKS